MHAYFANIGIFFDNMAHFESWQRLSIKAAVGNEDKLFSSRNKQKKQTHRDSESVSEFVEIDGVEPTTLCLQSRCSSQLSYIPKICRPEQI